MPFPDSTKKAHNVFLNTIDHSGSPSVTTQQPTTNFVIPLEPRKPVLYYNLEMNSPNIYKGDTSVATITTANVANGTILYWTAHGTVTISDFVDETMSGSIIINNNIGEILQATRGDMAGSDNRVFNIRLRTGSIAGPTVAIGKEVIINVVSR